MSTIEITRDTVRAEDLGRAEIFRELDEHELAQLGKRFVELQVPPHYDILQEGERAEAFYVVRDGRVKVYNDRVGEPTALVAELGPGEFFGELGLFGTGRQVASIRSDGPCRLFKISRRDLLALLEEHPAIERKLQATASYRYAAHVALALELGRRREVRIRFDHRVRLHLDDGGVHGATLRNLSLGGLSLEGAPAAWQEGDTVHFLLGLMCGELDLTGRISWRQDDRIGLAFERTHRNHDMLIQLTIRMLLDSRS